MNKLSLAKAMSESLTADREKRANESKSRFISVMSHEIRNPLTGVIMNAEMMDGTPLNSDQKVGGAMLSMRPQVVLKLVLIIPSCRNFWVASVRVRVCCLRL